MLKNLSVCSLAAFFLISCGSNGFEESRKLGKTTRVDSEGKTLGETLREELKLADKATGSYTNGLLLTVKNFAIIFALFVALPEQVIINFKSYI